MSKRGSYNRQQAAELLLRVTDLLGDYERRLRLTNDALDQAFADGFELGAGIILEAMQEAERTYIGPCGNTVHVFMKQTVQLLQEQIERLKEDLHGR